MCMNGPRAPEPHISELDDEVIEAEVALDLARGQRFADLVANIECDFAEIFVPTIVSLLVLTDGEMREAIARRYRSFLEMLEIHRQMH